MVAKSRAIEVAFVSCGEVAGIKVVKATNLKFIEVVNFWWSQFKKASKEKVKWIVNE